LLSVVIHPDDKSHYLQCIGEITAAERSRLRPPVFGGSSRQESVRNGLEALAGAQAPHFVLIHDAARPFVDQALVNSALSGARQFGAAIPGLAVTDTIKQVTRDNIIVATPDRAGLRAVQTPQAFSFSLILSAHRLAAKDARDYTDDSMVLEATGHEILVFPGDVSNFKITTSEDFARAMALLNKNSFADLLDIRVGQGYDVHAFAPGDHIWLGGVSIPHTHSLAGHSDADVLMHALTDALLGAICEGDIGKHFPPSDQKWKGASSEIFLSHACTLIKDKGGAIANVDVTIICEAPKIGPHRDEIRSKLAQIMSLDIERISIKATTTERLGFTGRKEGIASLALATVRLPC
jgi:2-C-methyl-D-erythritol 4-phosphate cytidylyltransferase/2-C-methyl-D-erythritol 2,4-cyclodiphosphate synthase